jgi:hypothetical protein
MAVDTIARRPGGFSAPYSGSGQALDRYARAGLWALPVYGLANFVGTLSSQPDYNKDFPAYARYISTPTFLASHLAASMLGTGIGLLGFTALFVYLASRSRAGVALAAFVTTIFGNVALVAMFGVAAFAQRAIGKAFLAGGHDVIKSLNSAVYGTPADVTAATGLALFFAGGILFAIAISASESLPKAAGILLAAWIPVFAIGSVTGSALAPIGAVMLIGGSTWIARRAGAAAPAADRGP